ncbi:TPA: prefoldin subunit alpha [Candidatus Micrarchaeota archaeon]|nr:prefoldin subunit alpha [Candidatus Micrarchaeota archaeon]
MAREEELQKIAMEMNYYRSQAEELQGQMRSLNNLIAENDAAREALKAMPENEESLFAIGEGVFVKAKPSSKKVFVEIGARVVVEKTFEEASAVLEARNAQLVKTLGALQNSLQQLGGKMSELNEQAESMQQ